MTGRVFRFGLCAAWLIAGPGAAAEKATAFLGRGFEDCDAYFEALARADLADPPDYFICHRYRYKKLFVYGYIRDAGQGKFGMTLVKDRRVPCQGRGDLVWSGRGKGRRGSASGRFECKDGAKGGYAFELERVPAGAGHVMVGTIFGGVDDNPETGADQVVSADFFIFSREAIIATLNGR